MRIALLLIVLALVGCWGPAAKPRPQTTSTGEVTECPAVAPADRSSCSRLLVKCRYPNEPRCPFAFCAEASSQLVWVTTYGHCPIACPETKPAAGGECAPVTDQACDYSGGPKCGYRMRCTPSGWTEEEITLCSGM